MARKKVEDKAAKDQDKGLLQKAVDAVDHLLHPESAEESQEEQAEDAAPLIKRKRIGYDPQAQNSDLAKHPKFDKFKKGE